LVVFFCNIPGAQPIIPTNVNFNRDVAKGGRRVCIGVDHSQDVGRFVRDGRGKLKEDENDIER